MEGVAPAPDPVLARERRDFVLPQQFLGAIHTGSGGLAHSPARLQEYAGAVTLDERAETHVLPERAVRRSGCGLSAMERRGPGASAPREAR